MENADFGTVAASVEALDQIHWFDHLNAKQRQDYIQLMHDSAKENESTELAGLLPQAWFDCECIYGEGDHLSIFDDIVKNSLGLFNPKNISETWFERDGEWEVSFSFNIGKAAYKRKWICNSDYIDEAFFELIQEAISTEFDGLVLCGVNTYDQSLSLMIAPVTAAQRARAQSYLDLWIHGAKSGTDGFTFVEWLAAEDSESDDSEEMEYPKEFLKTVIDENGEQIIHDYLHRFTVLHSGDDECVLGFNNGALIRFQLALNNKVFPLRIPVKSIDQMSGCIIAMDYIQDQSSLVIVDRNGQIKMIDTKANQVHWEISAGVEDRVPRLIQFSPDRTLVGCNYGLLNSTWNGHDRYFSAKTGEPCQEQGQSMSDWIYYPNGDATRNDFSVRGMNQSVIFLKDYYDFKTIYTHLGAIRSTVFAQQAPLLASACDAGVLHVFNWETGKTTLEIKQADPIQALSWLKQDTLLLVQLSNYKIRLYDVQQAQELCAYQWNQEVGQLELL